MVCAAGYILTLKRLTERYFSKEIVGSMARVT
jgi:hypothetical protein